ncbi:hypothetical protein HDU87_005177 [Geranomyces variabilis]|uniref:Uncharacterized protein n=1 Tax=Geranomyces variabilis TaxID=109894 RepID=A0AAD5XPF2_9FUNG|nr:hypothetical protein HDU87_005177 [Geranomyces variabilis]
MALHTSTVDFPNWQVTEEQLDAAKRPIVIEKAVEAMALRCMRPIEVLLTSTQLFDSARFVPVVGLPNIVLGDWSTERLLLTVEVRKKNVLFIAPGEHLADVYNSHRSGQMTAAECRKVKCCVEQAFGYMYHNKLQHGVLTTYEQTWVFSRKRDSPLSLSISSTIDARTAGDGVTWRRAISFIAQLATSVAQMPTPSPAFVRTSPRTSRSASRSSSHAPSPYIRSPLASPTASRPSSPASARPGAGGSNQPDSGPSVPPSSQRPIRDAQLTDDTITESDILSFDSAPLFQLDVDMTLAVPLGTGRTGSTFLGTVGDLPAAIKIVDPVKKGGVALHALERECRVYHDLLDLQGTAVARVIGRGVMGGMFPFLATEPIVSPGRIAEWGPSEHLLAQEALSGLHAAGYLHGDVRKQNVLFHDDPAGGQRRALLIDLETARRASSGELAGEMLALTTL